MLVFPHGLLALLDERLDAVLLNLLLAVDSELFLHFEFDRQSVSVPARFSADEETFHGLVTRNDVLHHSRENVTDVGLAVGGGRTVVEVEGLAALVFLDALFEDFVLFPESEHFLFAFDKVEVCSYGIVHTLVPTGLYIRLSSISQNYRNYNVNTAKTQPNCRKKPERQTQRRPSVRAAFALNRVLSRKTGASAWGLRRKTRLMRARRTHIRFGVRPSSARRFSARTPHADGRKRRRRTAPSTSRRRRTPVRVPWSS